MIGVGICRYCGQRLHADGHFECVGDGRPTPRESWLSAWIHHKVDVDWTGQKAVTR